MTTSSLNRNFGLDVIRATAISLVFISHCSLLVKLNAALIPTQVIRAFGAIGVDLFFILSGFLIGGILLKNMNNGYVGFSHLFHFWKRRWFRTLPNYFLILALNVLVITVTNYGANAFNLKYILFLQNFSNPHPAFFTEAWSLSVEEYAYLFLPFLLFFMCFLFKRKQANYLFIRTSAFALIVLLGIKIMHYIVVDYTTFQEWTDSFRKVVIYRIDSIYIGFVLVYFVKLKSKGFYKHRKPLFLAGCLLFLGLHGSVFLMNLTPQTHPFFYVFIYLYVLIISLALLFPYSLSWNGKGKLKKMIVFLSTRSYAIYLVNFSLILLPMQHLIDIENLILYEKIIVLSIFIFSTLSISEVIYKYFELPILNFRDKKFKRLI